MHHRTQRPGHPFGSVSRAWLTLFTLTLLCSPNEVRAQPGPRVIAKNLPCFEGNGLAKLVRAQLGAAKSRGWTLVLRRSRSGALTLIPLRSGRRIGNRRFSQMPERCEEQRQLVATVAVLAIESWRAEQSKRPKTRKPRPKRTPNESPNNDPRSSTPGEPEDDTKAPGPSTRNQVSDSDSAGTLPEGTPADSPQDEGASPREASDDTPSRTRTTEKKAPEEDSSPDPARALAQEQARRQAQAQRQKKRQPFSAEGGVGLGAAWGVTAQAGPELEGWVGARRPRLSLRAGLRLNYGLPRVLGPIRLHSGSVSATLQLCLRPGSRTPTGTMEFWICLGGMGGMIVAGGQGSDQDRQGLRPIASPTLSLTFPVAQRGRDHWSIALRGGMNLVRTRFELSSTQKDEPLLHSYTLPAFHLALQIRWRRSSDAR